MNASRLALATLTLLLTVALFAVTGTAAAKAPAKSISRACKAKSNGCAAIAKVSRKNADRTAPSVAWRAPTGGTVAGTLSGSSCQAEAKDDRGVSSVTFKLDGATISTDRSRNYNCSINTSAYPNGAHTLTAIATDSSGNQRSASVSVNFNNPQTASAPAPAPEPAPTPAPETTPAPTPTPEPTPTPSPEPAPTPTPEPTPTPTPSPAPEPAPTPTPAPEPAPSTTSSMLVGLDAGNYGSAGANEVKGAVNTVRYDTERGTSGLAAYKAAGLKVQLNFPGPYNSGGVCALNASSWVSSTLSYYKANTSPSVSPVIEVLNEPGGTWFWGSNAASSANAVCYRNLLKATYKAFHTEYGTQAPKILGTLDGSGGLAFGKAWVTSDWATYVDGFIVHPYGGTGSRTSSALGNHALVESAHTLTGGPIYITEVGWPTAQGQSVTGDSLQWSEADQATNITNFISWAKGTGYVGEVIYFNYRDYGTNMWYGVLRTDGSRKPAYTALREAAKKYGA